MSESASRTILFVDDVPMLRDLGSLFLARCGRVLTAGSGEEALEICRREQPDLVLTDLKMPDMDGAKLCAAIKRDPAIRRPTPVILLLSGDSAEDRAIAVRAGADDFLAKPLSRLSLTEAVNRFVRFAHVRGLPRVVLQAPVELTLPSLEARGVIRNLSRGGMFVESSCSLAPDTEVSLHFTLPETRIEVFPTAQVVWRLEDDHKPICGMGLRFLQIDGATVKSIDDYVFEHCLTRASSPMAIAP